MVIPIVRLVLERHDGVAALADFIDAGLDPQLIRIMRGYGSIIRVRKGWYTLPTENPDVVAAVRVGGRLDCASAVALHEETEPPRILHVAVPRTAARLRSPRDPSSRLSETDRVVVHWRDTPLSGTRRAVALAEARAHAEHCHAAERPQRSAHPSPPATL